MLSKSFIFHETFEDYANKYKSICDNFSSKYWFFLCTNCFNYEIIHGIKIDDIEKIFVYSNYHLKLEEIQLEKISLNKDTNHLLILKNEKNQYFFFYSDGRCSGQNCEIKLMFFKNKNIFYDGMCYLNNKTCSLNELI